MQRFVIAAAVAAIVATAPVPADDAKEANYYPLKKGNTWTYKVQGTSTSIKLRVASVDTDGALLETLVDADPEPKASERIHVKDDGVYRTEVNKMKPDAPIKIIRLPLKKDDSWEIDTKVGVETHKGKFTVREEDVTVPAGKYKALVVEGKDFEANGQKVNLATWYVDKVGIVKSSYSNGGVEAVLELDTFAEGK